MIANKQSKFQSNQKGFALLMTLIVVGVIISIGLSILDLSIKQTRLATTARDSEIAFHAANAGMECAQYLRRIASSSMETGADVSDSIDCFGESEENYNNEKIVDGVVGDGNVYKYEFDITWGGESRCSVITAVVANATLETGAEVGLQISDLDDHIPGYPDSVKECSAGERCTILSVKGYNRECDTKAGYGSVEREVLLQF